jgi:hypothetical protein
MSDDGRTNHGHGTLRLAHHLQLPPRLRCRLSSQTSPRRDWSHGFFFRSHSPRLSIIYFGIHLPINLATQQTPQHLLTFFFVAPLSLAPLHTSVPLSSDLCVTMRVWVGSSSLSLLRKENKAYQPHYCTFLFFNPVLHTAFLCQ